jgi:FAD synthetase
MIEPLDKAILTAIYVSSLDSEILPLEYIKNRTTISENLFRQKIDKMIEDGFVGHIHTLKDAKSQGDILVVVVARSSTALKINKHRKIYHDEYLRRELVSSIRYVDYAIIGREGTLYDTVEFVKPDIIALGYDQIHTEKEIAVNCSKRGINTQIIRLNTPVPGSKSTQIKEELGHSIYDI